MKRELLRRLRRVENATGSRWTFTTKTFVDEHGDSWERHTATSPAGVPSVVEFPAALTMEEWTERWRSTAEASKQINGPSNGHDDNGSDPALH